MVDTTKESTCYPVNSNDEVVLVDGAGSNALPHNNKGEAECQQKK